MAKWKMGALSSACRFLALFVRPEIIHSRTGTKYFELACQREKYVSQKGDPEQPGARLWEIMSSYSTRLEWMERHPTHKAMSLFGAVLEIEQTGRKSTEIPCKCPASSSYIYIYKNVDTAATATWITFSGYLNSLYPAPGVKIEGNCWWLRQEK